MFISPGSAGRIRRVVEGVGLVTAMILMKLHRLFGQCRPKLLLFEDFNLICMYKVFLLLCMGSLAACSGRQTADTDEQSNESSATRPAKRNTYAHDRQFLREHHPDLVELQAGDARALICSAYQGRVMTTTADGQASYGWLNYDLIQSGKVQPHMNAYGGEDRFWLGPEGGQYALFFRKGDPFDGEHWQTPAAIDTEPFVLAAKTRTSAKYTRNMDLTNYAGTRFQIGVDRTIVLLDKNEISQLLGVKTDSLTVVGVRSDNVITNKGTQAWTTQSGMPSIWILGMMNASPSTTIIVPYRPGAGQPINDEYFGKVPAERLQIGKTAALFRADAAYRSKIGVSPDHATSWLGSYDPTTRTLTLVTYSLDISNRQYVNSAWEKQKAPYAGDVINAYNDGPMKPGQPQMGKFYELESSSPAAALVPRAQMKHQHTTLHLQGPKPVLEALAQRLLSTDLKTLER